MVYNDVISEFFRSRMALNRVVLEDADFLKAISDTHRLIMKAFGMGNKIFIFGNGGSAAESQHFAGELVCMFAKRRMALSAIALTTDTSIITAQGNDFGFDTIFSRQLEAHCRGGDVVIALTTSDSDDNGHSANIHKALVRANELGASSVGLFSIKTRKLLDLVDIALIVPSRKTDEIQEVHLGVIHLLSRLIENDLVEY